jgi:uncharacterized protein (DUF2336 family)
VENAQTQTSFADIEAALSLGFRPRRFELLRRVTDLFIANVETCTDNQINIFDEIMEKLVERIERESLIELSTRLAPLPKAPINISQRLSRDDDIEIAQPMLEKSPMLSDALLVEIAKTKSQAHLSAIAGRAQINEAVTDVLIDRGDRDVAHKVVGNGGARLSRFGHTTVANRAAHDEDMAELFIQRADIPADVFEQLVEKASETVRQRLLARATPEMRDRIIKTVTAVSKQVVSIEALRSSPAAASQGARFSLKADPAQLKIQLSRLVKAGKSVEAVETFATLCGISGQMLKNLVRQQSDETIVILGKAAGLGWPDLKEFLVLTMKEKFAQADRSKTLFNTFAGLTGDNAQRILRFVRTSKAVSGADVKKMM